MAIFNPTPPDWTKTAVHAIPFCCPRCEASAASATKVWINRYSPVMSTDYKRKYQEFYECECGQVWWGWNTDRKPIPD